MAKVVISAGIDKGIVGLYSSTDKVSTISYLSNGAWI